MPYRSSLCLMAAMVREREVSPVELIDAHLQQIETINPKINAFTLVFAERAREAAKAAETAVLRGQPLGLLHGLPLTIKDSFDVAGYPTLCGSKLRLSHRAAEDSTAAARMQAAGGILLGKTNTPEFLSNYESDNFITGRTSNPWNLERTAGGSSGGEAAAIAAYCSGGGVGSDGGGSVRVPAHFCGIAALKPTPGRVSAAGHFPAICHPGGLLGVAGPMARTAQDLRLLFAALAGYDPADPFSVPFLPQPSANPVVRVGVMEQFYRVPVAEPVRQAVQAAAALLSANGVAVDSFSPSGLERAPNLWWFFFGLLPSVLTKRMIAGHEEEIHWTASEFLNKALEETPPTAEDVLTNLAIRDKMRASILAQMQDVPVIVMPPCGVSAFPHQARRYPVGESSIGLFQAMMPATPFNLLGFPALVVPFGKTPDGLPVGVQLVGRPWEEERLLDLAVRLEEWRGPFAGPQLPD